LAGLKNCFDLFTSSGYDWNSMLGPKSRHLAESKKVKIQGSDQNVA